MLNVINVSIQEGEKLFSLNGDMSIASYSLTQSPTALKPGKVKLQLKLFGLIPLKKINVSVYPEIKLVPGGHSIGVMPVSYTHLDVYKRQVSRDIKELGLVKIPTGTNTYKYGFSSDGGWSHNEDRLRRLSLIHI